MDKRIIQHKELAGGRWQQMSLSHQLANVGSEVERTSNWRKKGNQEYMQQAFSRALELLDLTIGCYREIGTLKELTRLREALVDDFAGENRFSSSDELWRKYFYPFNYSARRERG